MAADKTNEAANPKAALEEIKKFEEKVEEQKKVEFDADLAEIALLESRVRNETKIIYLDEEKKCPFRVRACLSDKEMGDIQKLLEDKEAATDPKKREEITYTILSKIAANKYMRDNPEWFRQNRDKYATQDMLTVYLGFMEQMIDRAERIVRLQNFRTQS